MNYIIDYAVRHWRGEFTLERAFWLNGVLVWLGFSFLMWQFSPSIHYIIFIILKLTIAIILWVGIWRSSYTHHNKKEAFLAKAAICFFALYLFGSILRAFGIQ